MTEENIDIAEQLVQYNSTLSGEREPANGGSGGAGGCGGSGGCGGGGGCNGGSGGGNAIDLLDNTN